MKLETLYYNIDEETYDDYYFDGSVEAYKIPYCENSEYNLIEKSNFMALSEQGEPFYPIDDDFIICTSLVEAENTLKALENSTILDENIYSELEWEIFENELPDIISNELYNITGEHYTVDHKIAQQFLNRCNYYNEYPEYYIENNYAVLENLDELINYMLPGMLEPNKTMWTEQIDYPVIAYQHTIQESEYLKVVKSKENNYLVLHKPTNLWIGFYGPKVWYKSILLHKACKNLPVNWTNLSTDDKLKIKEVVNEY